MTDSPTEEKATKTPRFRSAPYPAIALPKALERSAQMYEKALHHSVPVTVPAEAWGYAVKSSGLFATIAALKQYGLLLDEGSGDKRRFRLSDDALRIAKDPDPNSEKRKAAIHRAALAPPIYKELWEKYGSAAATGTMDMVLKTHLTLDRGDMGLATYADKAADDIITGFQKAISSSGLLTSANSHNDNGDDGDVVVPEDDPDGKVIDGEDKAPVEIKIGDFVQWESQGSLQFKVPRRVRWVSDDKSHIAVDESDTGIPADQVSIEPAPAGANPPPAQVPPADPKLSDVKVTAGQRKAVFPVSDGDVTFIFPDGLTIDGIEELEAYLAVFLKKEKRLAAKD